MTEGTSFGKVYGIPKYYQPHNSERSQSVSMSFIPTGVVGIGTDFPNPAYFTLYLSDDEGAREFAWLGQSDTENNELLIYKISSGTVSLDSTTVFPRTVTSYTRPESLKKVSDTLYCGYYLDDVSIKKLSIVPATPYSSGTASVDIVYTFTEDYIASELTIGKKVYYMNIRWGTDIYIKIYSFDLDSEQIGVEDSVRIDDIYSSGYPEMASSMGQLVWAIMYSKKFPAENRSAIYIFGRGIAGYGGGVSAEVYSLSGNPPPSIRVAGRGFYTPIQYNSKDYVIYGGATYNPLGALPNFDSVRGVQITAGAILINQLDVFPMPEVPFSSQHTFPAISQGYVGRNWINPSTGQIIGPLDIPGVQYIFTIFPTLDSITGNIYMSVLMDDGAYKIIAVSPSGNTINQTICTGLSGDWATGFNHGNFFVRNLSYYGQVPKLIWLANIVPPTQIQMIPEMS